MLSNIQRAIIRKLYKLDYWGGRHTSIDNLQKGFEGHLKGLVKKEAQELLKQGLVLCKPKPDGLHVFLNPRRVDEIRGIASEIK